MLTMRDHDVQDYTMLPDMDATDVGVLGADDWACLQEVGEYLAATEASQRFVIWLLHNGFGERGLQATSIRFGESAGTGVAVIGMEFAEPADFGDTAPFSSERDALLADATTIETAWRSKVAQGKTAPTVMLECTAGCRRGGEGHDIAHVHQSESEDFGND